jgi:uncharacterized protein
MSEPWYHKGLHFKCTECGKCCTGQPGYVWVSDKEIEEMARFLQISFETFIQRYIRKVGDRFSLIEHPRTFDCVFLKDRKCQVYGARPTQCRTFPWWPENLETPEAWKETAERCEGIDHKDATLISLEEIKKNAETS